MNNKFKTLLVSLILSPLFFLNAHAATTLFKVNTAVGPRSIYLKTINSCSDPNRYVEFMVNSKGYHYDSGTTFKNPGNIQQDMPKAEKYEVIAGEMAGGSGVGMECKNERTGESAMETNINLTHHQAAYFTVTWDPTKPVPEQGSCKWGYIN